MGEKKGKDKTVLASEIALELNENWQGSNCSYCQKYIDSCEECPLVIGDDVQNCCSGLWFNMDTSETW